MNRFDFVYIFDVKDANPNGDPDAGNLPRIDPETGEGLVTDVCLKRKVRNYVQLLGEGRNGLDIFIREREPLNPKIAEGASGLGLKTYQSKSGKWDTTKAKKRPREEIFKIQAWLCERYFDIRAFGGVLSTGPNAGQIRGPIQLSFARSVEPIVSLEHAITRVTDVDEEEGEMGRKFTVPYAVYRAHGFINPFLADQTGFSANDLELLWTSLENAFQFDQSAARPAGSMNARALIVFEHDNQLGRAPSHQLLDRVGISRTRPDAPARAWDDYEVTIDQGELPSGVTVVNRI